MIKKWKEKQILFFFFKKHLKTHSQTLFSTFLSVLERKNKTKNQWQLYFSAIKKKHKKKMLFFQWLIFFYFFFTIKIIFLMVKIFIVFFWLLKLFFQQLKFLLFFFDCQSYFFNSWCFFWFFFNGWKFGQWKKVKLRLFVSWGEQ